MLLASSGVPWDAGRRRRRPDDRGRHPRMASRAGTASAPERSLTASRSQRDRSLRSVEGGVGPTGTTIERGKYSVSDGSSAFTDQTHGGRYGGAINGTTLTQSVNGLTPVYEKR